MGVFATIKAKEDIPAVAFCQCKAGASMGGEIGIILEQEPALCRACC